MTLDEAIKHAKAKAKEQRYYAKFEHNGMMYQSCVKCAEEHEQLAEWLEQLEEYKQLEEHGRLIKLPCKVGDTVYKPNPVMPKEIVEMLLNAFDDSEEKNACNCHHNSNSRDNEPCCRCDRRQTNADRIRNMSDEELTEFITGLSKHCLAGIGKCDCSAYKTCDNCNVEVKKWLQSEAEQERKVENMKGRYLFRAKRVDNGEWIIGYLYRLSENNHPFIMLENRYGESYEVDEHTICQCTGLKDTNGTLIWENDIMVAHLDENYPEDETYIIILWHGSGFCSKENGNIDIMPFDKFDQEHFEVCGNIFDNQELLESEG